MDLKNINYIFHTDICSLSDDLVFSALLFVALEISDNSTSRIVLVTTHFHVVHLDNSLIERMNSVSIQSTFLLFREFYWPWA